MAQILTQSQLEIPKMLSHDLSEEELVELKQVLNQFYGSKPLNIDKSKFEELKVEALKMLREQDHKDTQPNKIVNVNLAELPQELNNAINEERLKSNNKVTPEIIALLDSFYFPSKRNIHSI